MNFSSLALCFAASISFLQNGCGNARNPDRSSASNQNSVIASASPTQPSSTSTTNQNNFENGASYEEARPFIEHAERCKHAPLAENKVRAKPLTGNAPLKVTFDGSLAYDPDGTKIVKWEWNFGNGQSAEGRIATYIYEKPGKYVIGLNVTDAQGQKTSDCSTGTTDVEITVN